MRLWASTGLSGMIETLEMSEVGNMVTPLEALAAMAVAEASGPHPCEILGHKWVSKGGANAGCGVFCSCSVPVNECEVCGDCDYGENAQAEEIRDDCKRRTSR